MRVSILRTGVAVLPSAFLMAGLLLASPSAQAQIMSFKEDFHSNTLPAGLEQPGFSPIYANGAVTFPNNDRRYLQTVANYNNTNFIAEVTVTVNNGSGGNGIAFFGLGSGVASYFYGEPRVSPTTYVRLFPDDFHGGAVGITTSTAESIGNVFNAAGQGTHRVRITWDRVTKTFTVAIQKNYTGGPFSPTATIVLTPDNEAFGDTNTRIYFGGAGNAVFDDLLVLALNGTPGATDCHGQSASGIVHQFGSMDTAASALGLPAVSALQNVIYSFCGN